MKTKRKKKCVFLLTICVGEEEQNCAKPYYGAAKTSSVRV